MNTHITEICRVTELPKVLSPNTVYHIKTGTDKFKMYLTDNSGTLHQLAVDDDLPKLGDFPNIKTYNPRLVDGRLVV